MGAIESVLDSGSYEEILNVGQKVGGPQYPNVHDDVMIVQALLNYVREVFNFAPSVSLLGSPASGLPEPYLGKVIKEFQRFHNKSPHTKSKVSEDGVVSRAKGKSHWGAHKMYTIFALNAQCEIYYLAHKYKNPDIPDSMIDHVMQKNPLLSPMVKIGSVFHF